MKKERGKPNVYLCLACWLAISLIAMSASYLRHQSDRLADRGLSYAPRSSATEIQARVERNEGYLRTLMVLSIVSAAGSMAIALASRRRRDALDAKPGFA